MSKRAKRPASMIPGEEQGEKFMAVLLWSQRSTCLCQACQYLREMSDRLISTHISEVKPVE